MLPKRVVSMSCTMAIAVAMAVPFATAAVVSRSPAGCRVNASTSRSLDSPPSLNVQPQPIDAPAPLFCWRLSSRLPLLCRLVVVSPLVMLPPPHVTFRRAAASQVHPRPPLFIRASWSSHHISSHHPLPLNAPLSHEWL